MFELTKLVLVRPVQKNIEYLPISQILEFHPERDIFHNAQSTDCDRRSYCVGLIEALYVGWPQQQAPNSQILN